MVYVLQTDEMVNMQKILNYETSLEFLAAGYKKLVGYTNMEEDGSPLKSINLEK